MISTEYLAKQHHKHTLASERLKSIEKSPWLFPNQLNAIFWVGLEKYLIPMANLLVLCVSCDTKGNLRLFYYNIKFKSHIYKSNQTLNSEGSASSVSRR